MFENRPSLSIRNFSLIGLTTIVATTTLGIGSLIGSPKASASPGFFEYQWDPAPGYKRLKYYQSTSERLERATYFFFLKPNDRKKGILKMTIKIPDYFDAKLTPEKFNLCKVKVGGYTTRTRCIKNIPALFEINKDQTSVEIFPQSPIPLSKESYAIQMKIFNPRKRGMFQLQALAQPTGDVPISEYIGTWNIDIQ